MYCTCVQYIHVYSTSSISKACTTVYMYIYLLHKHKYVDTQYCTHHTGPAVKNEVVDVDLPSDSASYRDEVNELCPS